MAEVGETAWATDDTVSSPPMAGGSRPSRPLPKISVDLRGSLSPDGPSEPSADLEVRRLLGEGGMGRVLLARQHSLARDVAVKTVKDGAAPGAARALLFEGVICGQLEHPSIVPVHALGVDQAGRPALVMKRVEGETWDTLRRQPDHHLWEGWGGDEEDRIVGHVEILMQVCNAVHFAHTRGIVHRDLKPENVLIGGFGDVYVVDWGVATPIDAPEDARLCGTPGYMAPEMVRGEAVDERTDVYLLGALLHELLTGELRHASATAAEALAMSLVSAPYEYDDGVPAGLARLANRACSVDPADRPESARAFRDALGGFLRHRTSVQLTSSATERLERLRALHETTTERRARHPDARDAERDVEDRRQMERLVAEAHFGFEQALDEWPDNAEARRGLEQLESILDERRAHTEALEQLAHDRDPRVGQRQRTIGFAIIAVVGGGFTVDVWRRGVDLSALAMFAYVMVLLIILTLITVVFRRRILANRLSRQLVAMLFAGALLLAAPRLVGLFAPLAAADALTRDMFMIAGMCSMTAICIMREAMLLVGVALAGGVAMMVVREHATVIFSATTSLLFVAAAIVNHTTRLDSSRGWLA